MLRAGQGGLSGNTKRTAWQNTNRLPPALEWQQANKLEIKVQGKKENLRRRDDARKTHPRDGSLSVSNPTRPFRLPWKRRKKNL